jgi:hypothetical protein
MNRNRNTPQASALGGVRPLNAGPQHSLSQKDVPDYAHMGGGMPDGPYKRTEYAFLPHSVWAKIYVDRPSILVRDTDAGNLYVIFCGSPNTTVYHTANIKYRADVYRRGQQTVYLPRPGQYDMYNDHGSIDVVCRIIDAASFYYTHPAVRDINAYDPSIAMYRSVGCSRQDPAALNTSNAGGSVLNGTDIVVTQTTVTVASTLGGTEILDAKDSRVKAIIQNRSGVALDVFLAPVAGLYGEGVLLESVGSDIEIDGYMPWLGKIYGIASAGSSVVSVIEMAY